MPRSYYVYILTNWNDSTMYIGLTNNLQRRLQEHKQKYYEKSFSARYNVNKLVYFEETNDVRVAYAREREIKKWRREKKNALVMKRNPTWHNLAADW